MSLEGFENVDATLRVEGFSEKVVRGTVAPD